MTEKKKAEVLEIMDEEVKQLQADIEANNKAMYLLKVSNRRLLGRKNTLLIKRKNYAPIQTSCVYPSGN